MINKLNELIIQSNSTDNTYIEIKSRDGSIKTELTNNYISVNDIRSSILNISNKYYLDSSGTLYSDNIILDNNIIVKNTYEFSNGKSMSFNNSLNSIVFNSDVESTGKLKSNSLEGPFIIENDDRNGTSSNLDNTLLTAKAVKTLLQENLDLNDITSQNNISNHSDIKSSQTEYGHVKIYVENDVLYIKTTE